MHAVAIGNVDMRDASLQAAGEVTQRKEVQVAEMGDVDGRLDVGHADGVERAVLASSVLTKANSNGSSSIATSSHAPWRAGRPAWWRRPPAPIPGLAGRASCWNMYSPGTKQRLRRWETARRGR